MSDLSPKPCPVTNHPFIRVYRDMVPPELCASLIARYDVDTAVRRVGVIGGDIKRPNLKRCNEVAFSHVWLDLNARFFDALKVAVSAYSKDVPTFGWIRERCDLRDSNYLMQVYEPRPFATVPEGAEGYDWHCDSQVPATCGRALAAIAYLNTVEEGGETAFRAWPVKIKPTIGSVAFFPPFYDYEHAGLPPISSRKAIVTSFIVYAGLPYQ